MKKFLLTLFLASQVIISAANALSVSADAVIDSISVGTTGTASFSFTGLDFFDASAAVNDVTPFFADDFYTDVVPGSAMASFSGGGSSASALAVAGMLPPSSAAAASDVDVTEAGNALAVAISELGYEVDGVGDVTIDIDVTLLSEIMGDTALLAFAEASATVAIFDSFSDLLDITDDFAAIGGFAEDDFFSAMSTLTLMFSVDGFDEGILMLETYANVDTGVAPVPVPAAFWLLLSALTALTQKAVRKNRK